MRASRNKIRIFGPPKDAYRYMPIGEYPNYDLPFLSNIHMGYYNSFYILILLCLYIGMFDDSIVHRACIGILGDGRMGNCNFRDDDSCDIRVPIREIFRTNPIDLLKICHSTLAPSGELDLYQVQIQTIPIMSHRL